MEARLVCKGVSNSCYLSHLHHPRGRQAEKRPPSLREFREDEEMWDLGCGRQKPLVLEGDGF